MRVLIYGDSNTWGALPIAADRPFTRLPPGQSYAEVARERLAQNYEILVDGMPDRTTDLDLPDLALNGLKATDFNGAARLPAALSRAMPLDLVVIMLGTNDLATIHDRSADIARAAVALGKMVEDGAGYQTGYAPAQVLLVTPAPLGALAPAIADVFDDANEKSRDLSAAFEAHAEVAGFELLDADLIVGATSSDDGVHLGAHQHELLGAALANKIISILE